MLALQRPCDQVLRQICVLVFIDQQVLASLLVTPQDLGMFPEQPYGFHQKIVEVERIVLAQHLLVALVDVGQLAVLDAHSLLPPLTGLNQVVLQAADAAEHVGRRINFRLQVQILDDPSDGALRVGPVVDAEGALPAHVVYLTPQQPGAEGVERADKYVLSGHGLHPLPHLLGRLVGEGDGHDPVGIDPRAGQIGNAVGDNAGLAAARAGQHKQGPAGMPGRSALRFRQAFQDGLVAVECVR